MVAKRLFKTQFDAGWDRDYERVKTELLITATVKNIEYFAIFLVYWIDFKKKFRALNFDKNKTCQTRFLFGMLH
jgi:hypothetical protein